jgi:hypothetical protein
MYLLIASSMRAMKVLIEVCWSDVELVAVVLFELVAVVLLVLSAVVLLVLSAVVLLVLSAVVLLVLSAVVLLVLLVPSRLSMRLSRDDVESCDGGGGGGAIPAVVDDADAIADASFDMSVSNSLLLIEPVPLVSRALKI